VDERRPHSERRSSIAADNEADCISYAIFGPNRPCPKGQIFGTLDRAHGLLDVRPAARIFRPLKGNPMKPITFSCEETLDAAPAVIGNQILDLGRWPDFKGYGVIPGIKSAEFEIRTPEIVGTRIRVTSNDGSSYVEEIVEWQPETRVALEMKEFSPPLARLATRFRETWNFEPLGSATKVVRSFEMVPNSFLSRIALSAVAMVLKQAISRHLRQLRDGASQ
jgi:Polyketide cyclase / dehydrase and lipid transport